MQPPVDFPQKKDLKQPQRDQNQPQLQRTSLCAVNLIECARIDHGLDFFDGPHDFRLHPQVVCVVQCPDRPGVERRIRRRNGCDGIHGGSFEQGEVIGIGFRGGKFGHFCVGKAGLAHQIQQRHGGSGACLAMTDLLLRRQTFGAYEGRARRLTVPDVEDLLVLFSLSLIARDREYAGSACQVVR